MKLPPAWGGMKIGGDYMCSIKKEDETGYIKKADAIRMAVRESTECVMSDEYTEADSARVGEAIARVIYTLQTMLPADVAPVRHGRWKHERLPSTSGGSYAVVRCSACEYQYPMAETRYCPNCGARMGGDADD